MEKLLNDINEILSQLSQDPEKIRIAKDQLYKAIEGAVPIAGNKDEYYLFGLDVCLAYNQWGIDKVMNLIKEGAHCGGLHLTSDTSIVEVFESYTNHSEFTEIEKDEYELISPYL